MVMAKIMIKELLKLPAAKLRRAGKLKSEIERLENQLENLIMATAPPPLGKVIRIRRRLAAAARRKISVAAKARWAGARARLRGRRRQAG